MIAHDLRAIFVHIQKTGGESISTALGAGPSSPAKHAFASELKGLYGDEAWRSYFKFAFVRNPWDRLVSWWSMIDRERAAFQSGKRVNKFYAFVLTRARTFDEFLDRCDEDVQDTDGRKWIYRNQTDYITDADGRLMVDFVGRFERLELDFGAVAKRIGGQAALPHVNRSAHEPYWRYYTTPMAEKVGHRFAQDIEMFGYRFGG
jgi:hypothetical protein